jgi:hypothetical protein
MRVQGKQMKRIVLAIVAMAWIPAASAGTLYKCIGPKGQTTVQSSPCPAGFKTEWARNYEPDRRKPRTRAHTQAPRARTFDPGIQYQSPSAREQQVATCKAAREHEAQTRRRNPNLTYDQLLALQERTSEACRGL